MSVRVLGLDISTCTGYAFWDWSKHESTIETGVIELPEPRTIVVHTRSGTKKKPDYHWDDWRVAQVGPKIIKIIKAYNPDFILIEERLRFSKTGDGGFAMTNAIHGGVMSHLCSLNKLFGTIAVSSWRAGAYGEGFEPPMIPDNGRDGRQKVDEKTGLPKFKSKDWGDIAVDRCESRGIDLPSRKAVAHNAAEAAQIALMWRSHKRISIPEKRAYEKYLDLLEIPRTGAYAAKAKREGVAA